jgi:zinc protease
LTTADLKRFHNRIFVPGNTVVAVVGDFDSEKIIAGIRKRTEQWKNAKLDPPRIDPPPRPEKSQETIISEPSAAQLSVYIGHLGIKRDNPDYYKLMVMDYVLGTGAGFTDRLSADLRDRQGLAYSVSARITGSAGEEPGMFIGHIGTFPDKLADVKAGFLREINRIREEVPSKEEVENVKKYLTGALPFNLVTCGDVAGMLLLIDRHRLGENYLADYVKAVEAVTPEDVRDVARKYLHPERLILVAAGPVDAAGKPLAGKMKD